MVNKVYVNIYKDPQQDKPVREFCPYCNGDGEVPRRYKDGTVILHQFDGRFVPMFIECYACEGKGEQ